MKELNRIKIEEEKETKNPPLLVTPSTEELGYLQPTYNLMQMCNQNMIRRNLEPELLERH